MHRNARAPVFARARIHHPRRGFTLAGTPWKVVVEAECGGAGGRAQSECAIRARAPATPPAVPPLTRCAPCHRRPGRQITTDLRPLLSSTVATEH